MRERAGGGGAWIRQVNPYLSVEVAVGKELEVTVRTEVEVALGRELEAA
jgi:hypothetical protein